MVEAISFLIVFTLGFAFGNNAPPPPPQPTARVEHRVVKDPHLNGVAVRHAADARIALKSHGK